MSADGTAGIFLTVVSAGYFFLFVAIAAYGVANLLQAIAVNRLSVQTKFNPRLLFRLVAHKTYLTGIACQAIGFVGAFIARENLPLFLVQSTIAGGLGVTAILGVIFLKWRLPPAEVLLLILLGCGLIALVESAERSTALAPKNGEKIALAGMVIVIAWAGKAAAKLQKVTGAVVLGGLAGLAFGSAAIASRPLAAAFHSVPELVTNPLLYIMLAYTGIGQLLLGMALQRGSVTAAVGSMDAAAAIPSALIGLFVLGDKVTPGREWLAVTGFVVTIGAVIGLTKYASPQHHHSEEFPDTLAADIDSTLKPVREAIR